jgi:hypothetical protein
MITDFGQPVPITAMISQILSRTPAPPGGGENRPLQAAFAPATCASPRGCDALEFAIMTAPDADLSGMVAQLDAVAGRGCDSGL